MNENVAISAKNLTKSYRIYRQPKDRLKEWLTFGTQKRHHNYDALKNVSFDVLKGECLGIIGPNGAGKSTILKIISGVISPSSGDFKINGKVVSLLELGTGFNPELNGFDNIYNSARLLGYDDFYIQGKIESIIEFADLGEFIYRPIKTYSSGMVVRLAFSLFANLDPDVFIVDEALSVGDMFFQQKCFSRIKEMLEVGATLIFVSHDFDAVRKLCQKVIVLNNGELQYSGDPIEAIHYYLAMLRNTHRSSTVYQQLEKAKTRIDIKNNVDDIYVFLKDSLKRPPKSDFCTKDVEILGIKIVDKEGQVKTAYYWGEEIVLQTLVKVHKTQDVLSNGVLLFDRTGTLVWGSGTINLGVNLGPCKIGDIILSELNITLNLQPGKYGVTVGVSSPDLSQHATTGTIHDRFEQFCIIEVFGFKLDENAPVPFFGVAPLPCEIYNYSRLDDGYELSTVKDQERVL